MAKRNSGKKTFLPVVVIVTAVCSMLSIGFSSWTIAKNEVVSSEFYDEVLVAKISGLTGNYFQLDKREPHNEGYDSFEIYDASHYVVDDMLTETATLTYYLSFVKSETFDESTVSFRSSLELANSGKDFTASLLPGFSYSGNLTKIEDLSFNATEKRFVSELEITSITADVTYFTLSYSFNKDLAALFNSSKENPRFGLSLEFIEDEA